MATWRARWRGPSRNRSRKLTIDNDPGCRKARREAKGRMTAIYADYEARQIRFDAREHREGGRVEGLIEALAGR